MSSPTSAAPSGLVHHTTSWATQGSKLYGKSYIMRWSGWAEGGAGRGRAGQGSFRGMCRV